MSRTKHSMTRRMASLVLALLVVAVFTTEGTYAAKLKASFKHFADAPSSNILQDPDRYYSAQGVAFDTYTGKDGYAIAISKLDKNKLIIKHFKQTAGGIAVVNSVKYSKSQIGHANDATLYKKGKQKYLFVAKGGDGTKTMTMIKLSDFNKGKAKTYPVKFKKLDKGSGTDMRGISYVGKKKVKIGKKKVNKDVFIVVVGRRVNMVYLKSLNAKGATFEKIDSQRIQAPKNGAREATANGVTYHKGKLYFTWGDEGAGGKNKIGKVSAIGYSALFKGGNPNVARKFPLVWSKTEHHDFTPEGVYFTKLEKKSPMYLLYNFGLGEGNDMIDVTTQKY